MMRVVFFDKRKETYHSVGGATTVQVASIKCNGRYTKCWLVDFADGGNRSYKCKDFDLYKIEI